MDIGRTSRRRGDLRNNLPWGPASGQTSPPVPAGVGAQEPLRSRGLAMVPRPPPGLLYVLYMPGTFPCHHAPARPRSPGPSSEAYGGRPKAFGLKGRTPLSQPGRAGKHGSFPAWQQTACLPHVAALFGGSRRCSGTTTPLRTALELTCLYNGCGIPDGCSYAGSTMVLSIH